MTDDRRINTYLGSLSSGNGSFLDELERTAVLEGVPIIRPTVRSLLKVIISGSRPKDILEVGTAVGYSAILMAGCMPKGSTITTIEKYDKRIPAAKENFKKSGYDGCITLLEGEAADILKELAGKGRKFGLIFMDAAKGQYLNFFDDVMTLLLPGGILVSDNVMQDGDVLMSRYAVARRDRTIHSRMREYLYVLTHDERLSTVILPVDDGVSVSVKQYETDKET
ncbi:MAG: O-methyltransferase [Lachnospiraceae bacterium]|nr:O-methyltransferase [Lachnospiraceae bacterium]